MQRIQTQLKKIEQALSVKTTQHIILDLDNYSYEIPDPDANEENQLESTVYKPSHTGLALHKDDSFIRVIKGPYGSGKSTSCCAEIVIRACKMRACKDGIRRSRWAIVRNTYGDLEATTYQTWLSWHKDLGNIHTVRTPRFCSVHTFNDGKGVIELELLFLALDRPDQMRKLKSLELSGVYLNEVSELPSGALAHFKGRVNKRYPAKKDIDGGYWAGIIADTNPPDIDHWIYKIFEVDKPKNYIMYSQPPALLEEQGKYVPNPEAENIEHLGAGFDYYLEMTYGQSKEWIKVYVMGEYGTAIDGKSVYTNYNDDLHAVESIEFNRGSPILMAIDPGIVCPAILLSQYVKGQLRAIKEFIGDYITVKELAKAVVKPYLIKHCQDMSLDIIRDPADTDHCEDQLLELGLESSIAKTNKVEARIRAQRDFLNVLVEGKAGYILSKTGCPILRKGFLGHYKYRRMRVVGEEKYKDEPDKNHPYSDVHDCQQYTALEYHSDSFVIKQDDGNLEELLANRDRDGSRNVVTGY